MSDLLRRLRVIKNQKDADTMRSKDSEIAALRAEIEQLRHLLRRYRTETPLGHQPHMIAHEVDAALAKPCVDKPSPKCDGENHE